MKKFKNIPPGYDGIWAVMRTLKRFTVTEIMPHVDLTRTAVQQYARALEKAGYLSAERGSRGTKIYTLDRDVGVHRPMVSIKGEATKPTGQQRMWMAIKALGEFDAKGLALAAVVNTKSARHYCLILRNAGYLRVVRDAKRGKSGHRELYCLVPSMDRGPKAPAKQRNGAVYDNNLHRVVWEPSSEGSSS